MIKLLRTHYLWFLTLFFLLANLLVWPKVLAERQALLKVAFLDIGQGDAIYIEAPNGNQILLDGGRGRQVLAALGEVMPFSDRSLDLVIASHPDADHIGGLVDVFDRYEIGGFMESGVAAETEVYGFLQERVKAEGAKPVLARRGTIITLDAARQIYLTVLFPDRDTTGMETNEASIIAKLTYGESDFLLTGDSPMKIEEYLTGSDAESLASEVLKLGHHGSKTSSSAEFLAAVKPAYAIISVGKNSYGHPSPEVLDRLEKAQIPSLRTDEEGTIIFETDGKKITWRSS